MSATFYEGNVDFFFFFFSLCLILTREPTQIILNRSEFITLEFQIKPNNAFEVR